MTFTSQFLSLQSVTAAATLYIFYVIGLYIYRAYFDRLSHIPGPKLAAATLWYEFYYDVIKKGRYTWEIERMHEKYGNVVRINPYEVHIKDSELIDQVYPGPQVRVMKYPWATNAFGLKHAGFATESHELHRIRRAAVSPYFSKQSLQRLEPGIQENVDKMMARLRAEKGTGRVINLLDLYACLTADVISQYAYAKSFGYLDSPDFNPWWHQMMVEVSMNGHVVKQFPFILPIMQSFPVWFVKKINPLMGGLALMRETFRTQALDVQRSIKAGEKPTGQTSIFYEVLTNPEIRPQEKEIDYLQDEAQTVIAAGTVTTGHILAMLTFYILSDPHILNTLRSELATVAQPGGPAPKWQTLEQLPYLTAVIQEGLRISYGVSHRLQRVFPDMDFTYTVSATDSKPPASSRSSPSSSSSSPSSIGSETIIIPRLTPISMTSIHVHTDPAIFPNPTRFDPDRFIRNPGLRKYIMSFSKGTRQCLGMTLAYAELYMTLAAVFTTLSPPPTSDNAGKSTNDSQMTASRLEKPLSEDSNQSRSGINLVLHDTVWERDVEVVHDFLNVSPTLGSKGIRATVQ